MRTVQAMTLWGREEVEASSRTSLNASRDVAFHKIRGTWQYGRCEGGVVG